MIAPKTCEPYISWIELFHLTFHELNSSIYRTETPFSIQLNIHFILLQCVWMKYFEAEFKGSCNLKGGVWQFICLVL